MVSILFRTVLATTSAQWLHTLGDMKMGECWNEAALVKKCSGLWMQCWIPKHWKQRSLQVSRSLPEEKFSNRQWSQTHCKNLGRIKKEMRKSVIYELAKSVSRLHSNRTPLEFFKSGGRATKPIQQRAADKNHLWIMAEHLSTDLCETCIHAQADLICHQK